MAGLTPGQLAWQMQVVDLDYSATTHLSSVGAMQGLYARLVYLAIQQQCTQRASLY